MRVVWENARCGRRLEGRFDLRTPEAQDATYRALKRFAAALDGDDHMALLQRIVEATGLDGHVAADRAGDAQLGPVADALKLLTPS